MHSKAKLTEELQNGIDILVGQAVQLCNVSSTVTLELLL